MAKKILTYFIITLCISSCANFARTPEEQSRIDKDTNIASNNFLKCQLKNLSEIDDNISDAKTIAVALTESCSETYFKFVSLYAVDKLKNDNQIYMFKQSMFTEQQKASVSINLVLKHRRGYAAESH